MYIVKEKRGLLQKTGCFLNESRMISVVSEKAGREGREKARKEESPKGCDSDLPLSSIPEGLNPLRGLEIEES